MAAGDWHQLGEYRYQETLHGPFVEHACVDCEHFCVAVPDYPAPRCETCSQRHHGAVTPIIRATWRTRKPRWLNPTGALNADADLPHIWRCP